MLERSLEEHNISYRTTEFSSGISLRRCLQRGVGISICPKIAIEQELQSQALVQLETREIVTETPVVMIWHIDKWCSSLLKLFMELTIESVSGK